MFVTRYGTVAHGPIRSLFEIRLFSLGLVLTLTLEYEYNFSLVFSKILERMTSIK